MPHAILMPQDFTAHARFDAELARIFERSWVHVADTTELPEPGAYVPGTIGRTPVLVVRGHDDQIRAFLNACPHRGATLAESAGQCERNLRCPYHGWSFASDGTLQGVPFREEFDCDLSGRNLQPLRTAVLGPLVFACLDPSAPAFDAWAGELGAAFARCGVERWQAAFAFDYEVRTNWKTYVENGLDGYHIPFVHDFLAGAIDVSTGESFYEPHGSYTNVTASEALTPPGMERGRFRFGMIFPNLIPVFSPIDFNYLRIDPVDAETIRLRGRGFDGGGELLVPREFRAAAFDATNKQDIAVVERVQRGLRARGLPPAVHSDLREARITHFEKLVAAAIG
ncbi:MAG TPA: aromatic ring-hydroxylating dioxygenase subunit alpha [Polyangia bacterium]|nr:aromatic ring-hydroxylating dioxygenase subunit alpha [Polyangia bacterium]